VHSFLRKVIEFVFGTTTAGTRYIQAQHAAYMAAEQSISRRPRIPDTRVHAVLYFIAPIGNSLSPLDIHCMRQVHEVANLVPVLAKVGYLQPFIGF
jgi:septin 3/9/12